MSGAPSLSFDNEVFQKFAAYAALVLLKTIFMSLWTARYRLPRQVFLTPEDYGGKSSTKALTTDNDVERVRRAHLNDLENILPFVLIGFLYVLTGPDVNSAVLHFRLFAGARILHSIVYLNAIRQPARVIVFITAFGVNLSMLYAVLKASVF